MASGIPYTPKPITDIFTADTDIDRRQCHRTVPMKVLALGLGRTGTACTLHVQLDSDQFAHISSNALRSEASRI